MIKFAIIRLQKLGLSECKSCMFGIGRNYNHWIAKSSTLILKTMCVKNAKKAISKLQKMPTALSRNCCLINVPILSAMIY